MHTFKLSFKEKIRKKKNSLARGFVSVKILLGMKRKARRFADINEYGTYHALMIKFKNIIRYNFILGTVIREFGLRALNDKKMAFNYGSLQNYSEVL